MQRMQQTSLVRFCDECGFANKLDASECASCRSPLASTNASSVDDAPVVAPVKIAPSPALEVTPGTHFATALSDVPREFKRGTLLKGRYYIQEELGRGGFSIVYHAVDLKQSEDNGGEVAIKRIQLSALTPRQVIDATETFNREITMLARFKGIRGIPRFYEQLTDPENLYLVMEYIKGQTLEEILQKKRRKYWPEYRVVWFAVGLTRIMHELHEANPPVIFRDLKPANVMLTPKTGLYLIDFGIARNYTPGKAKDTIRLGSPGYAPPEQYGSAQTDRRSDIYSLGATLQTLLTGRDPLDLRAGETSFNPKVSSPGLRKLLDQMLDPDPEQRPADMEQVQKSLKNLQEQIRKSYLPLSAYVEGLINGVCGGIVLLAVLWQTDWISFITSLISLMLPLTILGMIMLWSIVRGPKTGRFAVARFLLACLFFGRPGTTKSERRHYQTGFLTAFLLCLLILLWHMLG